MAVNAFVFTAFVFTAYLHLYLGHISQCSCLCFWVWFIGHTSQCSYLSERSVFVGVVYRLNMTKRLRGCG